MLREAINLSQPLTQATHIKTACRPPLPHFLTVSLHFPFASPSLSCCVSVPHRNKSSYSLWIFSFCFPSVELGREKFALESFLLMISSDSLQNCSTAAFTPQELYQGIRNLRRKSAHFHRRDRDILVLPKKCLLWEWFQKYRSFWGGAFSTEHF